MIAMLLLGLIVLGSAVVAGLLAVDAALGAWVLLLGFCAVLVGVGVAGELQPDPPEEQ